MGLPNEYTISGSTAPRIRFAHSARTACGRMRSSDFSNRYPSGYSYDGFDRYSPNRADTSYLLMVPQMRHCFAIGMAPRREGLRSGCTCCQLCPTAPMRQLNSDWSSADRRLICRSRRTRYGSFGSFCIVACPPRTRFFMGCLGLQDCLRTEAAGCWEGDCPSTERTDVATLTHGTSALPLLASAGLLR